jgi:hypothetical protein
VPRLPFGLPTLRRNGLKEMPSDTMVVGLFAVGAIAEDHVTRALLVLGCPAYEGLILANWVAMRRLASSVS